MAFPNPFKKDHDTTVDEASRVEPQFGRSQPASQDDSPWATSPDDGLLGRENAPEETVPSIETHPEPTVAPNAKAKDEELTTKAPQKEPASEEKPKKPKIFWFGGEKHTTTSHVPSDEELLARQRMRNRLVGAAALLLACVIIAPIFLDDAEQPVESTLSTTIPPVPDSTPTASTEGAQGGATESSVATATTASDNRAELPLASQPNPSLTDKVDVNVTGNVNANDTSTAKQVLEDEAARASAAIAAQKEKVEKAAQLAKEQAKAEKTAKTAEKETANDAAAPNAKGYFVQVMATSNQSKADAAVKRLRSHKLPAYKMKVDTKNGTLWRVRVGVFKTRDQAMSAIGTMTLIGYTDKLTPEMQ